MVDKTGEQPRLKRLREIEQASREAMAELNIWEVDAPEDYSDMSMDEKNASKYMSTFPYPYMNGDLHLGKFLEITK